MFTRSLALVLVVGAVGAAGCVGSGEAAEDQPAVSQNGLVGGFTCDNSKIDVLCHGSSLGTVLVPVEVIVKDVGIAAVCDGHNFVVLGAVIAKAIGGARVAGRAGQPARRLRQLTARSAAAVGPRAPRRGCPARSACT